MSSDEDKCKRCGLCCTTKISCGRMTRLGSVCTFLIKNNDGTTSCSVYDKRHDAKIMNGNVCLPIQDAISQGAVPKTCGYVDKKYRPRVIEWRK
jgi:uncharacterized cysteine cluster protein YcgN (CxxCxxCC family)